MEEIRDNPESPSRIGKDVLLSLTPEGNPDFGDILLALQEAATEQTERLGIGTDFLHARGYGYVVLREKIQLLGPFHDKEKARLVTYPLPAGRIEMYRDAYLLDAEGRTILRIHSLWVFMDEKTRRIRPAKDADGILVEHPEIRSFQTLFPEERLRQIPQPEGATWVGSFTVQKGDIDQNGHMNNTLYLRKAQAFGLRKSSFLSFEFESECLLGEKVDVFRKEEEGKEYLLFHKPDGRLSFLLENQCAGR